MSSLPPIGTNPSPSFPNLTGNGDTQLVKGANNGQINDDEVQPNDELGAFDPFHGSDPTVPLAQPKQHNLLPAAGTLLVSQTQVMGDVYDFMQVFQKIAQQMRNTARTQRNSEMQAQVSTLQNAAQEMRNAAAERYKAAITQAIVQGISGAVQVGMAGFSAYKTAQGMKTEAAGQKALEPVKNADKVQTGITQSDLKAAMSARQNAIASQAPQRPKFLPADLKADIQGKVLPTSSGLSPSAPPLAAQPQLAKVTVAPKPVEFKPQAVPENRINPVQVEANAAAKTMIADGQAMQRTGKLVSDSISGVGAMINSVGSIGSAGFTQNAAEIDADKANLDTQAKVHENAQQQANEMMQQMMDVIRDVRDKLQSIEQANIETARSISRNI